MMQIAVINGPNLNMLGAREPEVYGKQTLDDINQSISELAEALKLNVQCFQSNAEHVIIEHIHSLYQDGVEGIIINPAAFTHTSVAIRDALLATQIPFVEVHLSNVHAREEFRSQSWFSDIALGTITGLGSEGYLSALRYFSTTTK